MLCLLVVKMMFGFSMSMLQNGMYHRIALQGTSLQAYDTQDNAESSGTCSILCLRRNSVVPSCVAFGYNGLDGTCRFYTEGTVIVISSNFYVFKYQVPDPFRSISIGDQQFYIYLSSVKKRYVDARTHCQDLGGYLLQIDSLEEYEAIALVLVGHPGPSFFGANDIANEGQWVNDKNNDPINPNVLVWNVNDPNNFLGKEHCGIIYHAKPLPYLGDVDCSLSLTFFCELTV